jgi:hypothetical protein
MDKKAFIEENCIHLNFFKTDANLLQAVRDAVKKANESYVLISEEDLTQPNRMEFKITCLTLNFGMAYYHFGMLMAPVIEKHYKTLS